MTKAKTKVKWDIIDAEIACFPVGIPEGAITAKDIMDRYALSHSTANHKLRDLGKRDGFELIKVKNPETGKIMNVVIQN